MSADDRERSSLDTDAGPGSQGETDPGSEGDFTGAPMNEELGERDEEPVEPTREEQGI